MNNATTVNTNSRLDSTRRGDLLRIGIATLVSLTFPLFVSPAQAQSTGVAVNGQFLTPAQLYQLEVTYGRIMPGCYWYDPRAGLYGLCGRETAGVMRAGYRFAPLPENISAGNTAVFVNGRRLPMIEVAYLQKIFGTVLPGRYWLSGNGDYGFEAGGRLGNLYALARRTSGPHRVYAPGSLSGLIGAGGNYCTEQDNCVYTSR